MSRISTKGRSSFSGRGASSNPPGRFEHHQTEAVDDGWFMEEEPDSIATQVEPDRARGLITRNDSPDLPFDYSINPYRGCEHGCIYCLSGETRILMADGGTRRLAALRVGDAIVGTRREGRFRRYVTTEVQAHWSVVKPAFRLVLEDQTELIAGGDHRFLTEQGWKFVTAGREPRPHLSVGARLLGTGAFVPGPPKDLDYGSGYICGLMRGDPAAQLSLGLGARRVSALPPLSLPLELDPEALLRAESCLAQWRQMRSVRVAAGGRRAARGAVDAQADTVLIQELMRWPQAPTRAWFCGFLAGSFDAGGSYSQGVLRITSTETEVAGRIDEALRALSLAHYSEPVERGNGRMIHRMRIPGGLREHLRFFHSIDPAISRKRDISGQEVQRRAQLGVVTLEPYRRAMRLYDITTGTGDFIANGIISHNCYARPSHAYMGLSAGIDFETRLFYKADAGRVLEEELSRPSYVCKPINIGVNTDAYQPVERRLKVTRSILEVLARTRHPVSLITKSALILRDLDLLKDLARDDLVTVAVSITTLEAGTKRSLEPRTASPQARLRVLETLNAAGIPTGVMVAPVIPAITDHEMEAILAAAAQAGARWAGYTLVRLPHEVKDLFREWLAEHFPDRAAHVMSLIQDMRGGRDNDPRFGMRMRGTGPIAELLRNRFQLACTRLGLNVSTREQPEQTALFRRPGAEQLTLGF